MHHICLSCVYAQEVWVLVNQWSNGLVLIPDRQQGMERWWNDALAGLPKNTKQQRATLMTYTAWNI
ncbi:hypothetical protein HU200_002664 [Digitaria exilis]|uniref:Uncharacterized protein n=1 Tax=Digitaria exilis TaxID=1010633 RepID=A0A835KTS2_9POAL|nr:hypothetical protein HU200_002664 [Digitaria exilis]